MRLRFVASFAAFFALSATAQRLPTDVHAQHYALHLTPDLKAATFAGTETIDVVLDRPGTTITLNAIELKINSVKANNQTGAVSYDEAKEQATFTFRTHSLRAKSRLPLNTRAS